jgi:hypothetical protein
VPITVEQVAEALGLEPTDTADHAWMGTVVAAVNEYVTGLPVVADRLDPGAPWPPPVTAGALMLAMHQYQARNAPNGRATLDLAGGFQTAHADPEIARLLQLRRWAKPAIGGRT